MIVPNWTLPSNEWVEKAMATHSSTLAWKIPWTEESGRLHSIGSWRVGDYWATSLSLFTCMQWRRKWQPTPVFLPGDSRGSRAWWAAVYGVSQSWTRLKRLSSSSSSNEWEPQLHLIPANTWNFQSFSYFGADIVVLSFSDNQQCWGLFAACLPMGYHFFFFCQMPAPVFWHILLGCQL